MVSILDFPKRFNHKSKHFKGTILIAASIVVLTITYFPVVKMYLSPQPKVMNFQQPTSQEFYITIPKIDAQAIITQNIDPWNKSDYEPALQKGVAQAKGSALPGEPGTIFLFAHSSDLPWRVNSSNTSFLRLDELGPNDPIIITKDGKKYKYLVSSKKEVWPNEVKYLDLSNKDKPQLILLTCTPVGTSLKRLLVFANPF